MKVALAARSRFLTSPTSGGGSWLAPATNGGATGSGDRESARGDVSRRAMFAAGAGELIQPTAGADRPGEGTVTGAEL